MADETVSFSLELDMKPLEAQLASIPKGFEMAAAKGTVSMKKASDSISKSFSGKALSGVKNLTAGIGTGLVSGFKSASAAAAAFGTTLMASLGPLAAVLAPLAGIAGAAMAIKGRMTEVKAYRESLRDLQGEQERLQAIDKALGYQSDENRQKMRDLQIEIENLRFANRNLTESDIEREQKNAETMAKLTALKDTVVDVMMGVMDTLQPAFTWIVDGLEKWLIPGMGALMTAWTNGWDVIELATVSAQLGVVKAFENVKYYLTSYIPAAVSYFSKNWKSIFSDLYHNTFQLFTNMGKMIGNFFSSIGKLVRGGKWEFSLGKITEGMVQTTPGFEAPEREKSETEKGLEARMSELATKIGEGYQKNTDWVAERFDANFTKRMGDLAGRMTPISGAEMQKIMEGSQKSSTSDLVGAWQSVQSNFSNRNPAVMAADKQIAEERKIAAEQAGRDGQLLGAVKEVVRAVEKGAVAAAAPG